MGLIKVMEQAAELIGDHHSFCDYISLSLSPLALCFSFAPLCLVNESCIIQGHGMQCCFLTAIHAGK